MEHNFGVRGTGINTHISNNPNATTEDKCYCHITRMVNASVEVMIEPATASQRRAAVYEVSLEIMITASCKKENEYQSGPTVTHDKASDSHYFRSFKQTVCRDKECACDTPSPHIPGATVSQSTTCISSKIWTWTNVRSGTDAGLTGGMPNWAAYLLIGATPEAVAKRINTEEQHGSDGQDVMDFGPYDQQGHPKCSSARMSQCCVSRDSLGVST